MSKELTSYVLIITFVLTMYLLFGILTYFAIDLSATTLSKVKVWRARRRGGSTAAISQAIDQLRLARSMVDLEVTRLERWRDTYAASIPAPDQHERDAARH